ncbi:MAG TPA: hypothetical protein ENH10_03135 [Bacteroidetes bacterium]|nr:hypothetical protein BMS3Bbin04_00691 [bacterium BMS3Bbin04]HDO65011.1 hypothetical protein [Bacteroidota bacterium]HEX04136.1 hypothetical protein [Bacteroidota bacterium]
MPWTSKTMQARFDFVTPLDAAAVPAVQNYLGQLVFDIDGVSDYQVRSLRRLARGQIRVDIELNLDGENREFVRRKDLRRTLKSMIGSARYIAPRGFLTPLIRLYRTRLLA